MHSHILAVITDNGQHRDAMVCRSPKALYSEKTGTISDHGYHLPLGPRKGDAQSRWHAPTQSSAGGLVVSIGYGEAIVSLKWTRCTDGLINNDCLWWENSLHLPGEPFTSDRICRRGRCLCLWCVRLLLTTDQETLALSFTRNFLSLESL